MKTKAQLEQENRDLKKEVERLNKLLAIKNSDIKYLKAGKERRFFDHGIYESDEKTIGCAI